MSKLLISEGGPSTGSSKYLESWPRGLGYGTEFPNAKLVGYGGDANISGGWYGHSCLLRRQVTRCLIRRLVIFNSY